MRRGILIAAIVCWFAVFAWGADQVGTWSTRDYVIGPGDVLDISVWKDEALTKLVPVLPDGTISFPLVGQMIAAGKTVGQLHSELQSKLVRFVPNVTLNVQVQQVNSMIIYVIGRVNNPGRFVLNTNVNVLQALAMAGGLNPFAKRSKIKIQRQEKNQTRVFDFDYDEVSKGENLEQNIVLERGDVIVVP
jgi:polysaccharide export outer membrane protein